MLQYKLSKRPEVFMKFCIPGRGSCTLRRSRGVQDPLPGIQNFINTEGPFDNGFVSPSCHLRPNVLRNTKKVIPISKERKRRNPVPCLCYILHSRMITLIFCESKRKGWKSLHRNIARIKVVQAIIILSKQRSADSMSDLDMAWNVEEGRELLLDAMSLSLQTDLGFVCEKLKSWRFNRCVNTLLGVCPLWSKHIFVKTNFRNSLI
mgnify:CR=1 FL=1